jgi:hypothetical protein
MDVQRHFDGVMVGFEPRTDAARAWFDEHVQSEPWQWLGRVLWLDMRMAVPLADGIREAGLDMGNDE